MKTPIPIDNRPGLSALRYRVGTYSDFRESMLARLSDQDLPFQPLNQLRTRDSDDPTIALIDAFAVVGEVLTFYQERLANEGFLRTATDRQSVQQLAALTGYRLRPGVASSVFLAFTLDPDSAVTMPGGSRAQSVPGPGQTPQSFETTDDLAASGAWNAMQPRMTRPTQPAPDLTTVAVDGTSTGLKPNDPLLLVTNGTPTLRRVDAIDADADRKRTVIHLQKPPEATASATPAPTPAVSAGSSSAAGNSASPPTPSPPSPQTLVMQQASALAGLARIPPASHPPNSQALTRSLPQLFAPSAAASLTLTAGISPPQQRAVFTALAQTQLAPSPPLEVHAFRAATAPFGNRAPPQTIVDANGRVQPPQEWQLSGPTYGPEVLFSIEITANREGQRPIGVFLRDIAATSARGGTFSSQVGFVATIVFGETILELTLPPQEGAHTAGTLSAELGDVTATLVRLPQPPDTLLEFVFAFSAQPLNISVQYRGTDPPTANNLLQTDAMVTLEASEDSTPALRVLGSLRPVTGTQPAETSNVLHLDGTFDSIKPGTWVAFDAPADTTATGVPPPVQVTGVNSISRTAYGLTARTSRLVLSGQWINLSDAKTNFTRAIRQTSVYADSTPLTLVEEDITEPVAQTAGQPTLELDGLVTGLSAGRWLVVGGERTDMPGVNAGEVVMLASADYGGETTGGGNGATVAAGETPHTTLTFASALAYSYQRDTVKIYGNVASATQGESCDEILGSGNGASANQTFTLKKPPVTYVPAATPSGSASTLRIWVNNIEWTEVDALAAAAPDDKVFATVTGQDGAVTVQFGDGIHGARLPTGAENIRAHYRSGLGQSGNLDPGTITSLLSRPLGATGVTNPVAASGGADPESPDQARGNVPIGLVSLARLVSAADYQDFTLAFAGIGKAVARRFAGPDGPLIHLTLAGAADATLDPSGALLPTLANALRQFGDPALDVELAPRAARLALIQAAVAVDADRQWTEVEPRVRTTLLNAFGFDQRALGQSLYVSEVTAAIQNVPGVSYVDLRMLTAVPQPTDVPGLQAAIAAGGLQDIIARPARVDPAFQGRPRRLLPADLVYLSDALPDMLVLSEITS
jgi:predicted phage baseplate assembly protein